jgi:hypothetical protein
MLSNNCTKISQCILKFIDGEVFNAILLRGQASCLSEFAKRA